MYVDFFKITSKYNLSFLLEISRFEDGFVDGSERDGHRLPSQPLRRLELIAQTGEGYSLLADTYFHETAESGGAEFKA